MKKNIAFVLGLVLLMAFALPAAAAPQGQREVKGSLFLLTTPDDFAQGEIEGLAVEQAAGNGALTLAEGALEGTYTSEIIAVEPFEYLVASWNADTPGGTWVEISVRAYVDKKGDWSGWMSWGKWCGADIARASTGDEDDFAYMDVDTMTIKGSDGETASRVQVKAVLHGEEAGGKPVLRQIGITYKNTLDGQAIEPLYYGEETELPASVKLDTPAYSQMIRENSMASVMCSAVTICTLLNDRGEDALPEEAALLSYDSEYDGYGNWPYTVAVAGAYGYEAYVQYADLDILKQELAHGYSVGINVKYSSTDNGSYPYLENAAISSTGGHLIAITGYETIDGVEYFYSSDSAASQGDASCLRRYRADQLNAAWTQRVAYIVHEKETGIAPIVPNRVKAELTYVEGTEYEYALSVNGQAVALPKTFLSAKLRKPESGVIGYYIQGEPGAGMPEGVKTTTANETFLYSIPVASSGNLRIVPANTIPGATEAKTLHVFVMRNDGITYEATVEVDPNMAIATPAPKETAAPTQEAVQTPAAAAAGAEASAQPTAGGNAVWLIAAGIAIAVAAVLIAVLAKKKKQ